MLVLAFAILKISLGVASIVALAASLYSIYRVEHIADNVNDALNDQKKATTELGAKFTELDTKLHES